MSMQQARADLERKVEPVERDPRLEDMLRKLQERDRLFEYNVPPAIRTGYDNESLYSYLKRTYHVGEFVVEEPEEIKRYAQRGDRVVKKGEYAVFTRELRKGMAGKVVNVLEGKRAEIKFKNGLKQVLPYDDFKVTGRLATFLLGEQSYIPPVLPTELSNRGSKKYTPLLKRHKVVYTGRDVLEYRERIPDGTPGLLLVTPNSLSSYHRHVLCNSGLNANKLWILWANSPEVIQDISGPNPFRPLSQFDYREVSLIIPNPIDFGKFERECLGPGVPGDDVRLEEMPQATGG